MKTRFGLHIIQYPSGKFGFVGSVPETLGFYTEDIKQADVLSGRVKEIGGVRKALRFPSFDTKQDAVNYAFRKGVEIDGKA